MSKSIFKQPEKTFPQLLSQVNSFFGYTYSNEEKQEWWNQKKKFKIGLIRTNDLDKQVSIFGEFFDFSKKSLNQKTPEASPQNQITQKADSDGFLRPVGFDSTMESPVETLHYTPEKLLTSKDFETLYLGWLDKKTSYSQSEKDIITQSMKHLFRFIFGNKTISEVNNFHKNLIIAYTTLTPADKLPCDSSAVPSDDLPPQILKLRENMLESLLYRRSLALEETAKDILQWGEKTSIVQKKRKLLIGLRDMIDSLESNDSHCMIYGNDPTMKEGMDEIVDINTSRLLKVFVDFVADRKSKHPVYDFTRLAKELSEQKLEQTKGEVLYNQLLELLKSMTQMSDETEREYLELIIFLSFLLRVAVEAHKIQIELDEIKCRLKKPSTDDSDSDSGDFTKIDPSELNRLTELERLYTQLRDSITQSIRQLEEQDRNSPALANLCAKLLRLGKIITGSPETIRGNPDTIDAVLNELSNVPEIAQLSQQLEETRRELATAQTNRNTRVAAAETDRNTRVAAAETDRNTRVAAATARAEAAERAAAEAAARAEAAERDAAARVTAAQAAATAARAATDRANAADARAAAAEAAAGQQGQQTAAEAAAARAEAAAARAEAAAAREAAAEATRERNEAQAAAAAATRERDAAQTAAAAAAAAAEAEAARQVAEAQAARDAAQAAREAAQTAAATAEAEAARQVAEAAAAREAAAAAREAAAAAEARAQAAQADAAAARAAQKQAAEAAAEAARLSGNERNEAHASQLAEAEARAAEALREANERAAAATTEAAAARTEAAAAGERAETAEAAQRAAEAAQGGAEAATGEARAAQAAAEERARQAQAAQTAAEAAQAAAEERARQAQAAQTAAEAAQRAAEARATAAEAAREEAQAAAAAAESRAAAAEEAREQAQASATEARSRAATAEAAAEAAQAAAAQATAEKGVANARAREREAAAGRQVAEAERQAAEARAAAEAANLRAQAAETEAAAARAAAEAAQRELGEARQAATETAAAAQAAADGAAEAAARAQRAEAEKAALEETMRISIEAQRKLLKAFEDEKARTTTLSEGIRDATEQAAAIKADAERIKAESEATIAELGGNLEGLVREGTEDEIRKTLFLTAKAIHNKMLALLKPVIGSQGRLPEDARQQLLKGIADKLRIPVTALIQLILDSNTGTIPLEATLAELKRQSMGSPLNTQGIGATEVFTPPSGAAGGSGGPLLPPPVVAAGELARFSGRGERQRSQDATRSAGLPGAAAVPQPTPQTQPLEQVIRDLQGVARHTKQHPLTSTPPREAQRANKEFFFSHGEAGQRAQAAQRAQGGQGGQGAPLTQSALAAVRAVQSFPSVVPAKKGQQGGSLFFQKGGAIGENSETSICDTMITLLLLYIKNNGGDPQEFLDKAGATLDDLGQCPLVLKVLTELMDDVLKNTKKNSTENSYTYTESNINDATEYALENLKQSFTARFSPEDQKLLESFTDPLRIYTKEPPVEFQPLLQSKPYYLYGSVDNSKETLLHGLESEDDPEPIHLTQEESRNLDKDGLPLGGVILLYLTCLKENQDFLDEEVKVEETWNQPNLPKPKRSKEKAKTPKKLKESL
jgi:hypothetical protein